jgi:hypothetical protein
VWRRLAAWSAVVALLYGAASGCASQPGTPHGAPPVTTSAGPVHTIGPVRLSGWKLTLPVNGKKGDAAAVDPAELTPPWLVADPDGALSLWAPVTGGTTPNSSHARTELDSLTAFTAGVGRHLLSATVVVTQLPQEKPDVILGQIHGAGPLSSIPFVMLHDDAGAIEVVVKDKREGSDGAQFPLLSGVPLGATFGFTISDNGDGSLTFTATRDGRTATADASIPGAFNGAPVRFQAGDYQQADSTVGGAAPDDGARVTFHELAITGS